MLSKTEHAIVERKVVICRIYKKADKLVREHFRKITILNTAYGVLVLKFPSANATSIHASKVQVIILVQLRFNTAVTWKLNHITRVRVLKA